MEPIAKAAWIANKGIYARNATTYCLANHKKIDVHYVTKAL
jgi:hypothetical protein